MTREEAIYQLDLCKSIIYASGRDWLDERDIPVLDMAIEALYALSNTNIQKMQELEQAQLEKAYELGKEEAQQWIPCSERLPEPGEYYLVTKQYSGEYREIDIAKYDFDGWHKAHTVLAWCEMPEPYKGDKE